MKKSELTHMIREEIKTINNLNEVAPVTAWVTSLINKAEDCISNNSNYVEMEFEPGLGILVFKNPETGSRVVFKIVSSKK